jgi:hypothetical protein
VINRCLLQYARRAAERSAVKQAAHVKQALPAWGGGTAYAQSPYGPGVEAGYAHLLGLLPIPHAGVRLGGRRFGVSAGLPYLGVDYGREPGLGAQWNYPESIWSHLSRDAEEQENHDEQRDKKEKPDTKHKKKLQLKVASIQAMLRALRS